MPIRESRFDSPCVTQLRVHRWAWVFPIWCVVCIISGLLMRSEISVPFVLRPIRVPDFLVIVTVTVVTYPLYDWLFSIGRTFPKERFLRICRIVSSLILCAIPSIFGRDALLAISFSLNLWAATVLGIAFLGFHAWLIPTLGGLAVFIAGGTDPSSAMGQYLTSYLALICGGVACIIASIVYIQRGPRVFCSALT